MQDELSIFNELISLINLQKKTDNLPVRLLERIVSLLEAEAGSFMMLDDDTKMIRALSAVGPGAAKISVMTFQTGFGICGRVIASGESILTNEAYSSADFNSEVDKLTGRVTKNVLCVPINFRGRVIGAVEVMNKKGGLFTEDDKRLLELLGRYISFPLEIERVEVRYDEERTRNEALIENMPGGLLVVDTAGRITGFNRKAAQILAVAQYSARGRKYQEVFGNQPAFASVLEYALRTHQFVTRKEIKLDINGMPKVIGYSVFLIRKKDDRIIAVGMSFQDITSIATRQA